MTDQTRHILLSLRGRTLQILTVWYEIKLEKIYTTIEEVRSMLIKALEKERREIFKKVKIEGKIERKVEDAKNLLAEGLTISFISKVTGLSEAEILKLQSEV